MPDLALERTRLEGCGCLLSVPNAGSLRGGRSAKNRDHGTGLKIALCLIATLTLGATSMGEEFPLSRTRPAKTPVFAVDPTKDFHFELGRGSGWMGLDTIAFGRDGVVTLYKQFPDARWQTATLTIEAAAIGRIFEAVRAGGIMEMAAAYQADVNDGTQWVLWIKQAEHTKAIYFNNQFPQAVRRLAKVIDTELGAAGLASVRWKQVPAKKFRLHEKPLWNSIK